MLKARMNILSFIILCALILMGCAFSTPTEPTPQDQREIELYSTIVALESELKTTEDSKPEQPLPFEGLWVSESDDPDQTAQILVITKDSFYQIETYEPTTQDLPPSAREMFAEIESYDLENGHMTLRIQWFRTDGVFGGFDYPTALVTYLVEGDTIKVAISRKGDGQFPKEPGMRLYYRK